MRRAVQFRRKPWDADVPLYESKKEAEAREAEKRRQARDRALEQMMRDQEAEALEIETRNRRAAKEEEKRWRLAAKEQLKDAWRALGRVKPDDVAKVERLEWAINRAIAAHWTVPQKIMDDYNKALEHTRAAREEAGDTVFIGKPLAAKRLSVPPGPMRLMLPAAPLRV